MTDRDIVNMIKVANNDDALRILEAYGQKRACDGGIEAIIELEAK